MEREDSRVSFNVPLGGTKLERNLSKASVGKREPIPDYSNDTTWRGRVYKKQKKRGYYVDKTRLIYEAQQAAFSKDVTGKDLEDLLAEVNKQIAAGERFKIESDPKMKEMTKLRQGLRIEEKELTERQKKLRQEYLEAKNAAAMATRQIQYDSIGDDEDYEIALELLTLEVTQLQNEVDYLKTAYGMNEEEDLPNEPPLEEEESEERATEEANELTAAEEEEEKELTEEEEGYEPAADELVEEEENEPVEEEEEANELVEEEDFIQEEEEDV